MRGSEGLQSSHLRIPSSPQVYILPLLLLLAWALFVFSPLVADPDLWGHVRFGQDTLLTGQIVRPDPYSYLTGEQSWINHEWLTEVLYALTYNGAGPQGLIALNLLLSLALVALVSVNLRGVGKLGALLLTAGLCLVLRPGVLNVRPQVFTYLLFLLLLLLIDAHTRIEASGKRRAASNLAFVAAAWFLIALWVNLHGGVLAGVGVLYLWGVTYLLEEVAAKQSMRVLSEPRNRTVVLTLVLAPTALLVNPYGPELISFLLRTATVARPEIIEWQGVRVDDLWSWHWLAAVLFTAIAVLLSRRPRRLSLLIPLAVVVLLPLSAVRHIPLAALAAPVLARDHFADLWARSAEWFSRRIDLARWGCLRSWRNLMGLTLAAILFAFALPRLDAIVIQPSSAGFPVRAVALLKAAGVEGRLATEFNWGEYVIWHLGPQVQVSVDGRRETVYSEVIYRENLDFMNGRGQWDRLVDRPETNLALVDRERPGYGLMLQKRGWRLIYEDEAAAVFARNDVHPAAQGRPIPKHWPADGAGLAFPVAN